MKTVIEYLKEHIAAGRHSEGSAIAWLMEHAELPLGQAKRMIEDESKN